MYSKQHDHCDHDEKENAGCYHDYLNTLVVVDCVESGGFLQVGVAHHHFFACRCVLKEIVHSG